MPTQGPPLGPRLGNIRQLLSIQTLLLPLTLLFLPSFLKIPTVLALRTLRSHASPPIYFLLVSSSLTHLLKYSYSWRVPFSTWLLSTTLRVLIIMCRLHSSELQPMACPSNNSITPQAPNGSDQLLFPYYGLSPYSASHLLRNLLTHPPSSFWPPHITLSMVLFLVSSPGSAYPSSPPRQLPQRPRWRTAHLVVQLIPITSHQIILKHPFVTVL